MQSTGIRPKMLHIQLEVLLIWRVVSKERYQRNPARAMRFPLYTDAKKDLTQIDRVAIAGLMLLARRAGPATAT